MDTRTNSHMDSDCTDSSCHLYGAHYRSDPDCTSGRDCTICGPDTGPAIHHHGFARPGLQAHLHVPRAAEPAKPGLHDERLDDDADVDGRRKRSVDGGAAVKVKT